MSSSLLGVKPLSPGFDSIAIQPHPCGLKWAKGRVPTPHGPVDVAWEMAAGVLHLTVNIPAGANAQIYLSPDKTVQAGPGSHQFDLR